ncbi:MAG: 16S rRNA (cytosine(967)-C(5))-methyltransferase RsmB [Clostridia bacterium]|nr:16S rRNA (cytosine(967)-C(5))-methyltransferase RsmB [Clostridia bacterium]
MANARKVVQNALIRVHKDEGYSNLVWNTELEQSDLSSRDAAFATTLFYGVLERCLTLDYVIAAHSKTPVKKMDLSVLEALRMGIYQMLYMDSVPDRAAINESVTLVKRSRQNRFSGFVNGVLRSVQRAEGAIPLKETDSQVTKLSVTHSVPEELVSHYITHYGVSLTEQLLPSFLGARPLYIRVNTLKTDEEQLIQALSSEGIEVIVTEHPHTLQVKGGHNLTATQAFEQGLFHVQDPASVYACLALQVQPGMRVLDVCAAPGGKSFTLGQIMENKGELISCDLYDHKIRLMQQGAERLGVTCMQSVLRDATVQDDVGEFDRILCDLPCSGLGILGRKPEIRYKSVTFLDNLPDLQYGMLRNTVPHLKAGGILVFSTCTLNPRENQDNVERLLREFEQLEPCAVLPQLSRVCGEPSHMIHLLPHVHDTDGFFVSAVRRKGEN